MKYCGIELKSNEAIIVSIEIDETEDYSFIAAQTKKIKLNDSKSQEATKSFKEAFNKFFQDNNFNKIGVKERMKRGKFAGGADSFKMEGIIQTLDFPIEILHTATVKAKIKEKTLKTDEINAYQEEALKVALSLI
jgi:prolyl-tRNA synthetase